MDPLQLGWEPLVKSWMATSLPEYKLTQEQKDTIRVFNFFACIIVTYIFSLK